MLFNFEGTYSQIRKCSDNSEEVTPVPIPNTVVKLLSADDTWRATSREIRTSLLFSFIYKYKKTMGIDPIVFLCCNQTSPVGKW